MDTIDRVEAKRRGFRLYFTGVPCKRGHTAERLVANSSCIECKRLIDRLRAAEDREGANQRNREWCRDNPAASKAKSRSKYEKNPVGCIERAIAWNKANPELRRLNRAKWRRENPGAVIAAVARRNAAKLLRSVPWADRRGIAWYYSQAQRLREATGEMFHVDHIIPLRGDLVSGFHHQDNLQILTESENLEKGNRFDPLIA